MQHEVETRAATSARAPPPQWLTLQPATAKLLNLALPGRRFYGAEAALERDLAYPRVHQGWPEPLDQVRVGDELVGASTFAISDTRSVAALNDPLQESRERWRSDHGFVRVLARLRR